MKKPLLLAVAIIFSGICVVHAEIAKEKQKEIEKMLRLTGMEKMVSQIKTQMISSMKAQMRTVPDAYWEKLQAKMDTHELIEKIIPLYDKYYTLEDLKAVNAFYESPAGQKVLSTAPQIMRESMQIGQEWGAKIGRQAAEEAQKESQGK